jgi:hypothetical protein
MEGEPNRPKTPLPASARAGFRKLPGTAQVDKEPLAECLIIDFPSVFVILHNVEGGKCVMVSATPPAGPEGS